MTFCFDSSELTGTRAASRLFMTSMLKNPNRVLKIKISALTQLTPSKHWSFLNELNDSNEAGWATVSLKYQMLDVNPGWKQMARWQFSGWSQPLPPPHCRSSTQTPDTVSPVQLCTAFRQEAPARRVRSAPSGPASGGGTEGNKFTVSCSGKSKLDKPFFCYSYLF